MQRLVGSFLIIFATSCAGYIYAERQQAYIEHIRYLRYVSGLIKGELEYTGAPLHEIFRAVGERVKEPYRSWLLGTADAVQTRDESGFSRIWNRCVDSGLSDLELHAEHSILIKEAGVFLGQADSETIVHSMQLYLNRMDLEIEKLREGLASKKKLGKCLGIMGGIFLVIILL